MDYSKLDDNALLRLISQSNSEALSELYNRYSRLVFSLALHSTGDQATAEEITQDVFFRVWEKAYTYRVEQAKVSTWLTSIARYRAIDFLRRRGVRPEQDSLGWEDVPVGSMAGDDPDPEDLADHELERQRIRAAVSSLPPEQQLVLALAYFQGLTHREIAEKLEEPLGTVKTRIRLGIQKLRDLLHEDLPVRK